MVWRIFATKLETAETMEDADLHMRAPYFYPDKYYHELVQRAVDRNEASKGILESLMVTMSDDEIAKEMSSKFVKNLVEHLYRFAINNDDIIEVALQLEKLLEKK
jgi:hypothetical protein